MPQVMTTETGVAVKDMPLKEGEIRPNDLQKVYTTGKLGDLYEEGTELEVHPELAKKMLKAGKVSEKATAKK